MSLESYCLAIVTERRVKIFRFEGTHLTPEEPANFRREASPIALIHRGADCLSGNSVGQLMVWDLSNHETIQTLQHPSGGESPWYWLYGNLLKPSMADRKHPSAVAVSDYLIRLQVFPNNQ